MHIINRQAEKFEYSSPMAAGSNSCQRKAAAKPANPPQKTIARCTETNCNANSDTETIIDRTKHSEIVAETQTI